MISAVAHKNTREFAGRSNTSVGVSTVERYEQPLFRTGVAMCRTVAGKMDGPNLMCHAHASRAPQRTQTYDSISVQESAHGELAVIRSFASDFTKRP